MSLVPKDFSPNNALDRAVFKRKPSVFSAEDLNYSTGILKYAIDYINAVLGPLKTSNRAVLTFTSGPSFASGTLGFTVDVADETLIFRGTPILLPAQTVTFSRALSTSAPIAQRTLGLYLTGEYVQYVSSQKTSVNEYEFFAGIAKQIDDDIASVTNNTIQGGNPIVQTLEGFDYVGYRNFSYEVLSDEDYAFANGGERRLVKLATIVLESNGAVRLLNNVDTLSAETSDLNEDYPVSVPTYMNRLRQFVEEGLSTLQSSVNTTISNLANTYASLSGPNVLSGRNAKKVHVLDAVNINLNPLPVVGGGTINSVAALQSDTISPNVPGAAYYDLVNNHLVAYLNQGDHFEINFSANTYFSLHRLYCHPSLVSTTAGARNEITLKVNYPNGPITTSYSSNLYRPAVIYNPNHIDYGGVAGSSGDLYPMFLNSYRTCTIRGHFTAEDRFFVTGIDAPALPELVRITKELALKQPSTPINYPLGNMNDNGADFTLAGSWTYFPHQANVSLSIIFVNQSPADTRVLTVPTILRPSQELWVLGVAESGAGGPYTFKLKTNGDLEAPASVNNPSQRIRLLFTYPL